MHRGFTGVGQVERRVVGVRDEEGGVLAVQPQGHRGHRANGVFTGRQDGRARWVRHSLRLRPPRYVHGCGPQAACGTAAGPRPPGWCGRSHPYPRQTPDAGRRKDWHRTLPSGRSWPGRAPRCAPRGRSRGKSHRRALSP
ncbi:hypothetical protein G6F57_019439 [Rhizopus arrhizus]|nr:hypothetical protein G6F57_019439 [Rhizopus arrhizus]